MKQSLRWMCRPIAHRGLHDKKAGIIENTLTAVQKAIEHDYAVEIDIQPSADFTPMVFHDEVLDRLTEAKGPVNVISPAALRAVIFKDTDDHMPTLSELLQFVDDRIPVLIEIKTNEAITMKAKMKFANKIARTARDYRGRLGFMSFDPRVLSYMAKLAPNIPRGLVATDKLRRETDITGWKRFQLRHLLWGRAVKMSYVVYEISALPALAPFIARNFCKMPLLTWTVRTSKERRKAQKWADAMIFEDFCP